MPALVMSRPALSVLAVTLSVRVPAAPPAVIAPPLKFKLCVPVKVRSALSAIAFAVVVVIAAPVELLIVLFPEIVSPPVAVFPIAPALLIFSVPALNVVPPVKVFVFESVSVPAPDFVRLDALLTTPVTATVPPEACWMVSGESRKTPPLSVFVPLVFCESTSSALDVLLVTVLMVLPNAWPPVRFVSWKVAPSARFCVSVVPKSPPSRSALVVMLPPLLSFSVLPFIK